MSEKEKLRCHECMFRADPLKLWGCNYEGVTGHTRMAQPPEKCTYFRKGERLQDRHTGTEALRPDRVRRDNAKRLPPPVEPKYDWEKAQELYALGKNDGEIARVLECPPNSVRSWRRRNNLPANAKAGGKRGRQRPMILEDIMRDLRAVEKDDKRVVKSLAGQAAEAIEILLDRVRYLEEKLAGQ